MGNLITYIEFRGDLTFKAAPFNDVDACILSQLVGLPFYELLEAPATLEEYALIYKEHKFKGRKLSGASFKEKLFLMAGESERFKNITIEHYETNINAKEVETFYAVTFKLARNRLFVAFRGTDGSLISWKENFHTLYNFPTLGQTHAKQYLDEVLARPFVHVMVGGHSKGGNLAVYAAMFGNPRNNKKIERVYSFDGPGYMVDITQLEEYKSISDRITSYIPEECVVGKLMNPPYNSTVVKSDAKGVYQHALSSWVVRGTSFDILKGTNELSRDLSGMINSWIYKIPRDEMGKVVDELFDVFYKNKILHIDDLMNMEFKTIIKMIRSITRLSPENREFLVIIFKEIKSSK